MTTGGDARGDVTDSKSGSGGATPASDRQVLQEDRDHVRKHLDFRERSPLRQPPSPQALGIWSLAWPTMAASLMQTAVRWVDIKMVGVLGGDAIAAVTAAGQVYWLVQTAVMAVSMGLTAIAARAFGANDMAEVENSLRQSLILGAIVGLGLWVAFLPILDLSLIWLGLAPEVVGPGADYMFWLMAGNVPFTLIFLLGAALRAGGDTITPLWTGVIANVINVFLNWVLIYGNLGAPALGVAGAAMASSAAVAIQTLMILVMWQKHWTILPANYMKLTWENLKITWAIDWSMWKRIWHIGYPAMVEGILFQGAFLGFMALMATYGTTEFVAYQIGVQVLAFAFLPGHGFSVAASTLVGQHLGAGEPDRAAAIGWRAQWLSMIFMGLIGGLLVVVGEPISRWFLDDDAVVPLAQQFIWILAACMPLMAFDFTIGGGLRGAGDTRTPLYTTLVALFLGRLLPGYLAAVVFETDVFWLWMVLFIDYTLRAIILGGAFWRGKWKELEV